MLSQWSEQQAAGLDPLDLLVYSSRLIGADDTLVVWGGGNTSIKQEERDFRGRPGQVLRVKGSGTDMKSIQRKDFPGVRMDDVLALLEREQMSDEAMVAYLRQTMTEPDAARPSIETLLHAWIPEMSVAHSHADAILMLSNNCDGDLHLIRCFGKDVSLIPYLRPGFALSKQVAEAYRARPGLQGVVLMKHGLVTWGEDSRASYDKHLNLVTRAEEYVQQAAGNRAVFGGVRLPPVTDTQRQATAAAIAPAIRGALGAGRRVILRFDDSPDVLEFLASERAEELAQIGPATPDHLMNTKRLPLWLEPSDPTDPARVAAEARSALARYKADYAAYVERHNHDGAPMLDATPRVVLVPGVGMWTCGRDARAARISGDIYHHTIAVMRGASALAGYESLDEGDAFGAEYWPLELYKLTLLPPEQELAQRVALVTGAAGGIGRAIAIRLAAAGAHVVVTDIDTGGAVAVAAAIEAAHGAGRAVSARLDVTSEQSARDAFALAARSFGGVDIVVSNAGIAEAAPIEQMDIALWQRSLDINATGHFLVAREALRMMRLQGTGGSMVFIASKNVPAPGKDFAAYSAAKAAEAQLARIVAIEGAEIGVRANMLHPDAIFEGSGLFSPELRAGRAAAHGIQPDDLEEFYRRRNLLQTRVFAEDVADAALFLASDRAAKTTGAALAVDGGVREAFSR